MKRIVSIILMVTLLMGSITVHAESLEHLKKDIKSVRTISTSTLGKLKTEMESAYTDFDTSAWYADYMAKLVGVGGINGYTNGTVKPNGTITRAEFTKILIASLYGEQDGSSIHWAWKYKEKAEDVGILSRDEFSIDNMDAPITRQEMAKMIVLAAEKKYREKSTVLDNVDSVIKDITTTNSKYQDYVRIAYSKGIIGGYPDKTFRPEGNATRAEACTILVRLMDGDARLEVVIEAPKERETIELNGYTLPVAEETEVKYEISTKDEIAEGYCEIQMRVFPSSTSNLEEQYETVEKALLSKFSKKIVDQAMEVVQYKKVPTDMFDPVTIYEGDRYIYIETSYNLRSVFIQVYRH